MLRGLPSFTLLFGIKAINVPSKAITQVFAVVWFIGAISATVMAFVFICQLHSWRFQTSPPLGVHIALSPLRNDCSTNSSVSGSCLLSFANASTITASSYPFVYRERSECTSLVLSGMSPILRSTLHIESSIKWRNTHKFLGSQTYRIVILGCMPVVEHS